MTPDKNRMIFPVPITVVILVAAAFVVSWPTNLVLILVAVAIELWVELS